MHICRVCMCIIMCFYVYIVHMYAYIYMYIHMYIYIVQTSQYKESKFHFRAKLLLSNFSSALGISIRHACFFFFCFTSSFHEQASLS